MLGRLCVVSLVLVCVALVSVGSGEDKPAKEKQGNEKKAAQARAIFAQLKSLKGTWIATKGERQGQVAMTIEVTAGGSAVVEREFPGTDHEMITVYHLDGNNVMLNHYCILGNQPRMKARPGKDKKTIEFRFAGATNLASKDAPHMHEGRLTIIDKDNLKSTWVLFRDGKAAEEHAFEMRRKK